MQTRGKTVLKLTDFWKRSINNHKREIDPTELRSNNRKIFQEIQQQ
jgi:hypothetical protein